MYNIPIEMLKIVVLACTVNSSRALPHVIIKSQEVCRFKLISCIRYYREITKAPLNSVLARCLEREGK